MKPFPGIEPGSFAEATYRSSLNLAVLARCKSAAPLTDEQAKYLAYLERGRKQKQSAQTRKAANRDYDAQLKIGACADCIGAECCPFRSNGTRH